MRKHFPIRGVCLTALAALALAVAGCSQPSPQNVPPAPPSVGVVHPERKSINRVVEQPGAVQAYEEAQLFARVPGYVRLRRDADGRLLTDIGREVRGPKYDAEGKELEPGDVLAELQVPELEQDLKDKQALVRQAAADVEQAEKALAAAEAGVTLAEASVEEVKATHDFWESQANKFAGLVEKGALDPQSREETQMKFRSAAGRLSSAKAAVVKARADRDKAAADVTAAKARVDVATAKAGLAAAWLGYATIRAPFDGIVTRRRVSNGDLVQPGGKNEWLFTVARLDPVRVAVAVPEADAELVRTDAEVKLSVPAAGGPALTGKVARTSWDLEHGSRTLRTEIDLPNKGHGLRPGMYVYARIVCPLPEAWVLPASAVVKQDDALVCFRIVDGKAVRTPVQVSRGDGQFIEVVKYQTPGTSAKWETWTGKEEIAGKAAGLSDGQAIQMEKGEK
jgi:multidrug efflux pump subunit AcrA (membrane-fusion protein)